jgi:hypothetical protein
VTSDPKAVRPVANPGFVEPVVRVLGEVDARGNAEPQTVCHLGVDGTVTLQASYRSNAPLLPLMG